MILEGLCIVSMAIHSLAQHSTNFSSQWWQNATLVFFPFIASWESCWKVQKPCIIDKAWQLVFAKGTSVFRISFFFSSVFRLFQFVLICRRLFLFHCYFNLIAYLTEYKADFVLEAPVHLIELPSDRNLELVWYMPQILQNIGYLGSSHVFNNSSVRFFWRLLSMCLCMRLC